ncbi:hypothetical protein E2562_024472 [Oryza meyeriana var. granulata]|uniref:Uncharacterized protein n=1 Tax=Oryza meyeriana var. granulata TaxID=110450 RepID=A0A6G1FBX2_9ORYZ|nr:hypothetical protein E2562_024472 [Oryza meyeriana var. granulata]
MDEKMNNMLLSSCVFDKMPLSTPAPPGTSLAVSNAGRRRGACPGENALDDEGRSSADSGEESTPPVPRELTCRRRRSTNGDSRRY